MTRSHISCNCPSVILCLLMALASFIPATNAPAKEHPPLVLIHGLGSSSSVWDETVPFLHDNYQVFVYEMPGHGSTRPIQHATIDNVVHHLEDYIAANKIEYPYLVGHAMGGLVAMKYTFAHPGDVRRLIVMDAAPRQLATTEEKEAVTSQLLENYDRFIAQRFLSMSALPQIKELIVDQALRTDSATLITLLMDSFDFDVTEEMPRQAVPILVIGSSHFFPDPDMSRQFLYYMGFFKAETLHFKRLGDSGHFAMLELPLRVAGLITTFAFEHSE